MKKILLSIFCCMLAVIGLQAQSYVKVTTAPADWEGDYLIVYETNSVAFNGGLSTLDAKSNTIAVTIVDNEIAATDATNAAKFTIEAVSGGYAIKSASGNYIGVSSNSNGLKQTTTSTTYKHSLSIDASANAVIKAEFNSSTMALRFNKATDNLRFRYYKNAGQQAIQLYKYTEGTGGGDEVIVAQPTFNPAAGAVTKGTEVELSCETVDATIYYALGESDDFVEYNEAITINEATTIKAYAKLGDAQSATVSATYTIAQLPAPTFDPAPGAVVAGTVVTISTVEGAEMAYSVNGEVLVAETSAPVTINEDTEIEVFASMDGYINSETVIVNYTIKEPIAPGSTIADVLTADKFAATSTKYTDFSNVSVTSDAVYAGNNSMAIDKDNAIQLRSTDQAGIVTTVSGGKVKKVTVTWNSNTNAERVMNVYGKNTPYISADDLYDSDENTQGALIASIACGTTELVIEGDYEYIGLRSKSGAMYLDEIQIEWYKPYPENIVCEQNYYLDVEGSDWTIAEGNSLAAYFVNKNTDATTWSVGEYLADTKHYVFYLSQYNVPAAAPARAKAEEAPVYTHVKFVNFEGATDALTPWVDGTRVNETAELTYTPAEGNDYTIYSVAGGAWVGKNDGISTGLEAVEADGMVYAGNVVAAEGAIEVYNLSGAVVARGNNRVDLNGLAGGVYVVRCGNDVLKVVR